MRYWKLYFIIFIIKQTNKKNTLVKLKPYSQLQWNLETFLPIFLHAFEISSSLHFLLDTYFCEMNIGLVIDLITLSNKLFLFQLLKTLNDSE